MDAIRIKKILLNIMWILVIIQSRVIPHYIIENVTLETDGDR